MKEVFCDFCKFKCDEQDFEYDEIEFRNDKQTHITHGTLLCKKNIEIKLMVATYYWNRRTKKKIIVDDCSKLNENNNCEFFKPKLNYFINKFFYNKILKIPIENIESEQSIGKSELEDRMKLEFKNKVIRIISERLTVHQQDITLESRYDDEVLNADSLDLVELVMAFEDEFNIEIPDEDAEQIKTVNETIKYLQTRIDNEKHKQTA